MKHVFFAASAAVVLSFAPFAEAQVFPGALTEDDPRFHRPLNLTTLSGAGTSVAYDTFFFEVLVGGSYSIAHNRIGTTFDPYLVLYSGAFNPASPLTNLIAFNDDGGGNLNSLITTTLTPGVSYFAVPTTFANNTFGPYTLTFTGPAPIVIPEPATLGFASLAGIALLRRRR